MPASHMKTALVTVLVAAVAALVVGLAVMYSGIINVAATKPHYALTEWVLATTMEHSVERRAGQVKVPSNYDSLPSAPDEYGEMCEACHGAPGKDPSAIGKGLRPKPPDLARLAPDTEPAELFWVVKHGIRMTGMPAFAITHSDEKLWPVVVFVKMLPHVSAEAYRRLRGQSKD